MANVSSSNGLEKRPKLRFPGFDEPWENRKFSAVFSFLQNNTLSRSELDTYGKVLNIHYGDVLIKYGSVLDASDQTIPYIVPGNESPNYVHLQDGDVVIADTAEDETVGKTTEIYNVLGSKIEAGLHTIPCRPMIPFAPKYLGYYMNTSCYHKQLIPLMQGIKVLSVSKGNISKTEISAPNSLEEQKKISSLLYLLDQRAAIQSKIIEALKKYKRGVMRAIFRDKAILFSETTKWKSVRLGDECTFFSGGTPKSTDSSFYGGAIPFIRSGEIHSDKTELFLTDDGLKYSSAKMVSKGDLIIALYGATSGEVDISKIDGAINQAILCIRPSWINKVYLKYLLEDKKNDILNTYLQGGQGNLSAEIIKNLIFDIPDECSQLVVVDFLNTMDRRINSSIRLMENLITLRFGLMQQLFI